MGYTLVKITTYYPEYLKYYYNRYPSSKRMSYADQYDHMMRDAFGLADFYSKNFRKLGVNAYEIVANAEHMQIAWAKEHGIENKDILIEQLRFLKPDVVIFQDASLCNENYLEYIRAEVASIRKIIGCCGAPYNDYQLKLFGKYDYMITFSPEYVEDFKSRGINVYWLYHAFEKSLLQIINQDNEFPEVDVIFVGGFDIGSGWHNSRYDIIKTLIHEKIDLKIYSKITYNSKLNHLLKYGLFKIASFMTENEMAKLATKIPYINRAIKWSGVSKTQPKLDFLEKMEIQPIFGIDMYKALNKAMIGFNIHIDSSKRFAGNMRCFEITGVGSCLVTDNKQNIGDLFEVDKEIVVYNSKEECIEKIKWLVYHPNDAKAISRAGQERTLKDHSYEKRAEQMNMFIKQTLNTSR